MATKVKVIDSGFDPGEGKAYQVGDTFLLENPMPLVKAGKVVVIDEAGNEIAPPGIKYSCPICKKDEDSITKFVDHMDTHKGIIAKSVKPTVAEAENTRGSAEPNVVAPVEETVPADSGKAGEQGQNADGSPVDPVAQRMAEIRAKRLAALEKARQARKVGK